MQPIYDISAILQRQNTFCRASILCISEQVDLTYIDYIVFFSYRLHRFSTGLSSLLKATKKSGHTSTGLMTAHLEAWKLVPGCCN